MTPNAPQDASRASLELLYNISRELASTIDLNTVLSRVLFLSTKNVGAERGTLIVVDDQLKPQEAALVVRDQFVQPQLSQLQQTLDSGLAGWVMRSRTSALLPDTSKDERWVRRADDTITRSGSKSAICVPLLYRDQLTGVLTLVHPDPGFFNQEHLALLQAISDQAGIAVYNARLYNSLENATRRYRELFEDSIDPILITNLEGRVVEANRQAARTTGYSREEFSGKPVFELHVPRKDLLGERFQNIEGRQTISYESVLITKSNARIPIEVYVRKIDSAEDVTLQWTLRDISERKALDALHEDLSAMVYHDLRSPLANIVSSIDMLETLLPLEENSTVRSVVSIASRSTERMQRLISSLLDINKLEAGQPITNVKDVSVHDLLAESIEALRPVIDSKSLKITLDFPSEFPMVRVDPDMIRRVMINLLENATKFTPSEGEITLGGRRDDGLVRMWVRDSGPGIPPESQEHIFDKFIRLQTERFPKGIGLGLAFCRLAVRAHGGNIWVESNQGQGSCFTFTLPVAENETAGQTAG